MKNPHGKVFYLDCIEMFRTNLTVNRILELLPLVKFEELQVSMCELGSDFPSPAKIGVKMLEIQYQ